MIRDFLFSIINKEFLIFLFFLVLSTTYWLMSVLNETMEREIIVPVKLSNIPDNAIVLTDETVPLRVTIRDKGYTIAAYLYGEELSTIKLPFANYFKGEQRCIVNTNELNKLVAAQLYSSSKILSIKPERLEFPFNQGQHKRLPIRFRGTVKPADSYHLARITFSPDSVMVYSSQQTLDSLQNVVTEPVNILDFNDTISQKIRIESIKGSKIVPNEVRMTLYPDILVEAAINVPITPINVPEGMVMRTFPSQIQVNYIIGAARYHKISQKNFMVVADYGATNEGEQKQCQLKLVKAPSDARNIKLKANYVDYLLEQ